MSADTEQRPAVLDVTVKNWPPNENRIRTGTEKTYVLDPASPAAKYFQICTVEPSRYRLVVVALDADILLTTTQPTSSPDTSVAAAAPLNQGSVISATSKFPAERFSADAYWIVSLGTIGRVTVTREYF